MNSARSTIQASYAENEYVDESLHCRSAISIFEGLLISLGNHYLTSLSQDIFCLMLQVQTGERFHKDVLLEGLHSRKINKEACDKNTFSRRI